MRATVIVAAVHADFRLLRVDDPSTLNCPSHPAWPTWPVMNAWLSATSSAKPSAPGATSAARNASAGSEPSTAYTWTYPNGKLPVGWAVQA